jgi:glyoxylase-like metal-dependent hydrolase (beta-lactamase superfamily II)
MLMGMTPNFICRSFNQGTITMPAPAGRVNGTARNEFAYRSLANHNSHPGRQRTAMRKLNVSLLAAVALLGLALGAWLYVQLRALDVVPVTEDLHMITGLGGNVGVLKTGVGTVIVDSMTFKLQGEHIRQLAESITGEPLIAVINTHYHSDHTHGNPGFPAGIMVVSTARTLEHLHQLDGEYWQGDAADLLPNQTFVDEETLTFGDKTLHLLHPGRGHTDGDLIVLFVEDAAVHLGDLYFNRRYPNIDLEAGGSVVTWGDTLDAVLALQFTHVIPGHGDLGDRAGVEQFQRFMRQLAAVGNRAAAAGQSKAEMIETAAFTEDAGYQPMEIPFVLGLNRAFVLGRAWEEATGRIGH